MLLAPLILTIRGEAAVLVENKNLGSFDLRRGMRIAQAVFVWAVVPEFKVVDRDKDLSKTVRGIGGFGSTGL